MFISSRSNIFTLFLDILIGRQGRFRTRKPGGEPPGTGQENYARSREATGEREEVFHAIQLSKGAGHEKLQVVEVLAASSVGKRNHVERKEASPRGERNRHHVAH